MWKGKRETMTEEQYMREKNIHMKRGKKTVDIRQNTTRKKKKRIHNTEERSTMTYGHRKQMIQNKSIQNE